MRVLITGGQGFIARNLFEQLQPGYTLMCRNRHELDLLQSDEVHDFVRQNRFDVIIHTATYDAAPEHSNKDPAKVLENNLKMFFNLARCEDHFERMIYFGSGAEFGREYWKPRMSEDYFDQHVPLDQYGFSKYIMTRYSLSKSKIINLRLFGVFGKYDDWRVRFISNACCYAALGLPIKIHQNRNFDFLYVDDLVRIIQWFLHNEPQRNVLNVCSGSVLDFKTVAEKIIRISGKSLKIEMVGEGFGQEYSGDNSKLLNELKKFEFSDIDESIKSLYQWYYDHRDLIEKDKL
ncbi:MAG: NAD-dependent epimerase/dehydratase [uncultured bacterium]|nr:MAG: NAD-dependent epimerase/dehydratase [uncultured bacterium]